MRANLTGKAWQVGIDIGGTFTDLAALQASTGEYRSIKVPTQATIPSPASRPRSPPPA